MGDPLAVDPGRRGFRWKRGGYNVRQFLTERRLFAFGGVSPLPGAVQAPGVPVRPDKLRARVTNTSSGGLCIKQRSQWGSAERDNRHKSKAEQLAGDHRLIPPGDLVAARKPIVCLQPGIREGTP